MFQALRYRYVGEGLLKKFSGVTVALLGREGISNIGALRHIWMIPVVSLRWSAAVCLFFISLISNIELYCLSTVVFQLDRLELHA